MLLESEEFGSPGLRGTFEVDGKVFGLFIIHHTRGISYTIFTPDIQDGRWDMPTITAPYFIFWLNKLG